MRVRHLALSTEEAYVFYVRDFVRFHNLRHPRDMGALDRASRKFLERFL